MVLCAVVEARYAERLRKYLKSANLMLRGYAPSKTYRKGFVLFPVSRKFRSKFTPSIEFTSAKLKKSEAKPEPILPFDVIGDICIIKAGKRGISYAREAKKIRLSHTFIRRVFVKVGQTEGVERVPRLRPADGDGSSLTLHRENGLGFWIDVTRAYFNPRLNVERLRIAQMVRRDETVLDMFAGVGPFGLTIAKFSGASVDCVDVNNHACASLKKNVVLNGLEELVRVFCQDIRDFQNKEAYDRIIMNLPFGSLEFAQLALRLGKPNCKIHVYVGGIDSSILAKTLLDAFRSKSGRVRLDKITSVFEYAPRKWIFRADVGVSERKSA